MIGRQLELRLGSQAERCQSKWRQGRVGRARWWFERMHEVVNRAPDWGPAPERPKEPKKPRRKHNSPAYVLWE